MKRIYLLATLLVFVHFGIIYGQGDKNDYSLNAKLKMDPTMRTGTLDNGMRYYIRKNAKPEHRAEMRLAVHTGSIMENDSQQGLAQLCEHMAFNGTKTFSKNTLVDYLESIGTRFGADLNAYTSYDETVYMLQLPTDTEKFVTEGLQILEDWAHNVTYDSVEIDKERGVVIEEWRLGRGAFDRMGRKVDPIIYNDSRYAIRNTIGLKNVIAYCKHDTLKKFYHDWYRPDLQAVVVVGDFDLDKMEEMVKAQFSKIPPLKNERPRTVYTITPHKGTVAAVATDKENPYVIIRMDYRHDRLQYKTVKDYRDGLKQQLFSQMVSARLTELQHQANSPFAFANAQISEDLGQTAVYGTFAFAGTNDIAGSVKTLITENERVKRYGFTAGELDRAKKTLLNEVENMYKEKDKTDSKTLTEECVRNFLDGEDILGIANDYAFSEKFVPEITLDEVNSLAKEWITDDNNDVVVEAPDKDGLKVPTGAEILEMVNAAKNEKIAQYDDKSANQSLMDKKPAAGKVVKETKNKETGTTEWLLSNGARVVLKPTDFKDDEILFSAYSPGGSSLAPDKDYVTCKNAASVINNSGIGSFDANTLTKMLAGKTANVSPSINDLYEEFSGNAAPKDAETMFQLLYLYFTKPREDNDGFASFISQEKSFVQNQTLSPEGVLSDSAKGILSNHNFRRRPTNVEILNEIDESKISGLYKERFGNAGNFTFFFVGNFKPEDLKPLVETYIGSLPSSGKKENWKDEGITFPKGVVKKTIVKGTEPKSFVLLAMKGKFDWNMKNKIDANAMMEVLNITLRQTMREDKSGVYGVFAYLAPARYPKQEYTIYIQFGCAPENVDMLVKTAFDEVEKLQKEGPSKQNMEKVTETLHRQREINLKDNQFWLNALQTYYMNDDNISDIMKYDEMVNKITAEDLQKAANTYFDMNNYVEIVLVPEK